MLFRGDLELLEILPAILCYDPHLERETSDAFLLCAATKVFSSSFYTMKGIIVKM